MAIEYKGQQWEKGQVITAGRLNDIEDELMGLINTSNRLEDSIVKSAELNSSTKNNSDDYIASTAFVGAVANSRINALDVESTTFSNIQTIQSISETDGKISVSKQDIPATTTSSIGLVQIGSNIDVNEQGVISIATNGTYDATNNKIATENTVSTAISTAIQGLDVASTTLTSIQTIQAISETDGKISVSTQDIPTSTTSSVGLVQIGSNINVDNQGVISIPAATTSSLGLVQAGSNINIDGNGVISIPLAAAPTTGETPTAGNAGLMTADDKLAINTINSISLTLFPEKIPPQEAAVDDGKMRFWASSVDTQNGQTVRTSSWENELEVESIKIGSYTLDETTLGSLLDLLNN